MRLIRYILLLASVASAIASNYYLGATGSLAVTPVAYAAFTDGGSATGTITFTHTPVGTPGGAIVYVLYASATDQVTGVTYGGVTMTEVSGSPNSKATGFTGTVHAYFLGSSIPTGAQSVVVSVSGATAKRAISITLTGGLARLLKS